MQYIQEITTFSEVFISIDRNNDDICNNQAMHFGVFIETMERVWRLQVLFSPPAGGR